MYGCCNCPRAHNCCVLFLADIASQLAYMHKMPIFRIMVTLNLSSSQSPSPHFAVPNSDSHILLTYHFLLSALEQSSMDVLVHHLICIRCPVIHNFVKACCNLLYVYFRLSAYLVTVCLQVALVWEEELSSRHFSHFQWPPPCRKCLVCLEFLNHNGEQHHKQCLHVCVCVCVCVCVHVCQ